ncbi:hypothetical protein LCGC14_0629330 [marine sediment metagenome]|uniref:Terminase small subunit n=1 Tax=marine sediment metagenome TaxID=412755 RepID=A0A0F9UAW8_9ZZZZ
MLTQKQESFALNLFSGMKQREAYLSAGYSAKQLSSTIDENASRMAADSKVKARIEELRLPAVNSTKMLVAEREEKLSEFGRETIEGKFGISRQSNIAAIQELNKMDKLYTDSPATYQDNRVVNIIVSSEKAKELTERVGDFGIFNREE